MDKIETFSIELKNRLIKKIETLTLKKFEQFDSYLNLCESQIEKIFLLAWLEQLEVNKLSYLDKFIPYKYFILSEGTDINNVMKQKIGESIKDNNGIYYFDFLFPQFVVDNYRLDFLLTRIVLKNKNLSLLYRIAIECDGHDFHEKTKEQAQRDKARDRYLQYKDIQVLRFTGSELYNHPRKCIKEVYELISHITKKEEEKDVSQEEVNIFSIIISNIEPEEKRLNFKFSNIRSLDFDSKGNLFVVEGKYILKVEPSGSIYVLFNNSWINSFSNVSSQFNMIKDIAIDKEDNIYVIENHTIKKVKPSGLVQVLLQDNLNNFRTNLHNFGTLCMFF